mgnify:CR=1 FL=1
MPLDFLRNLDPSVYPVQSDHQQVIEEHFGDAALRELSAGEKAELGQVDLFFVGFANRSGSTLLTELMYQIGMPVPPRSEAFNGEEIVPVSQEHGIGTFTDYFLKLVLGWEKHGQAGFKIGARQLFWLTSTGLLSNFRSVRLVNPTRRDIVAQAVSLYIARQTKVWHTKMGSEDATRAVEYSRDEMVGALRSVSLAQNWLDYYVSLHSVPCLRVVYEDLIERPGDELDRVIAFLGYTQADASRADLATVNIRQQRGELNERLRAEFLQDFYLG